MFPREMRAPLKMPFIGIVWTFTVRQRSLSYLKDKYLQVWFFPGSRAPGANGAVWIPVNEGERERDSARQRGEEGMTAQGV